MYNNFHASVFKSGSNSEPPGFPTQLNFTESDAERKDLLAESSILAIEGYVWPEHPFSYNLSASDSSDLEETIVYVRVVPDKEEDDVNQQK